MRILWVTSQILNPIAVSLGQPTVGSGGWVLNMLEQLIDVPDLTISVAMPGDVSQIERQTWRGMECYVLPRKGSSKDVDLTAAQEVVAEVRPDLIQIEGTEFGIQRTFAKIDHVTNLVSLQGIINGIEPYQLGQLNIAGILASGRPRRAISVLAMSAKKRVTFSPRARIERETLLAADNFLGRTEWDRAHSYFNNPSANYFSCRRILRGTFYQSEWRIEESRPETIFIGNGYSPLKGLHNVVTSVALLVNEFPNIQVRVAGVNPLEHRGKLGSRYGYPSYLSNVIKQAGVSDRMTFLGMLDAADLKDEMLAASIYVLPSLIENSPNTLGEAMLLGVPSIASYVGGVTDMGTPGKDFLMYRASDPTMLAWNIKKLFNSPSLAHSLSVSARQTAREHHDPAANAADLLSAYRAILSK